MPGNYKVTHAFQGYGGDSRDQYVNSIYFHSNLLQWDDVNEFGQPWAVEFATWWRNFFTVAVGTGFAVKDFMSDRCTGLGRTIKVYDMDVSIGPGGDHGPPVWQVTDATAPWEAIDDGSPGTMTLPEECAACLSYEAINSGTNRARRRGRIYLGPLMVGAINLGRSSRDPVQISTDFRDTVLGAAQVLKTVSDARGWVWRVFSQTDNLGFDIIQVSMDNLFDTIRGRGNENGARSTVVL